jgi:hypothetical protein
MAYTLSRLGNENAAGKTSQATGERVQYRAIVRRITLFATDRVRLTSYLCALELQWLSRTLPR